MHCHVISEPSVTLWRNVNNLLSSYCLIRHVLPWIPFIYCPEAWEFLMYMTMQSCLGVIIMIANFMVHGHDELQTENSQK